MSVVSFNGFTRRPFSDPEEALKSLIEDPLTPLLPGAGRYHLRCVSAGGDAPANGAERRKRAALKQFAFADAQPISACPCLLGGGYPEGPLVRSRKAFWGKQDHRFACPLPIVSYTMIDFF
jgi:hypothetical protein